jgi:ComF family protein
MCPIHTLLSDFSHLFFPHICAGCGTDALHEESPVCIHCAANLPTTNFITQPDNLVEKIFWGRLPLACAASAYYFTKDSLLQHLLHLLKYKGRQDIGVFLGNLIGQQLNDTNRFSSVDGLLPLPLFKKREKKRGYNQAELLAQGISNYFNKPIFPDVVQRRLPTETQTHKSRIERWQNMEGTFEITNIEAIAGKHILLIDDVITTGATLEACGTELLASGCLTLSVLSLAYTVK